MILEAKENFQLFFNQAVCALRLRCIVVCNMAVKAVEIGRFLLNISQVRPFLFLFTIGKFTLIYSEFVKVIFYVFFAPGKPESKKQSIAKRC